LAYIAIGWPAEPQAPKAQEAARGHRLLGGIRKEGETLMDTVKYLNE